MDVDNPTWPPVAHHFMHRYADFDRRLKLAGHLKRPRGAAQADWSALAKALGAGFYDEIRNSGAAPDLIGEPPRTRMASNLRYEPDTPDPIADVRSLFMRGVCKVRHNLVHGEKFDVSGAGWDRDVKLVTQSLWVLDRAAEQVFLPGALLAGPSVARPTVTP